MSGTMDLNEMLVFVRVVQAGSLTGAAKKLGMPKSTVSRKISDLEERIAVRLLQRTTRTLGLTDAGRIYFDHAARIVREIEEAEEAVGQLQATPRGLLRVTAPLRFGLLGKIVIDYLQQYPDVQVELVCTDRLVDIVAEGFDVAIRAGPLSDSALIARKLDAVRQVLVAAPSYCNAHGVPESPTDLTKHACITFGASSTARTWTLFNNGQRTEVRITPRMEVNDPETVRDAAIAGLGIAWTPEPLCAEELKSGQLRRVLPDWCSAEVPLHALMPTARHLSPKVVAFMKLLTQRLRLTVV